MTARDDEPTQVNRRPSATIRRASSSVIPRIAGLPDVPKGPEQEEAIAQVFGDAIDLIAGNAKELVAKVTRLEGELANVTQERDLLRAQRDRVQDENAKLRKQLHAARGGR